MMIYHTKGEVSAQNGTTVYVPMPLDVYSAPVVMLVRGAQGEIQIPIDPTDYRFRITAAQLSQVIGNTTADIEVSIISNG